MHILLFDMVLISEEKGVTSNEDYCRSQTKNKKTKNVLRQDASLWIQQQSQDLN